MSYCCLATARFEAVAAFYRDYLGGMELRGWDRPRARGLLLELHGLRLEILDATRESRPLSLPAPGDRVQLVIEVPDVDSCFCTLGQPGPAPVTMSWGARCFALRDPDGIAVNFVQWLE